MPNASSPIASSPRVLRRMEWADF